MAARIRISPAPPPALRSQVMPQTDLDAWMAQARADGYEGLDFSIVATREADTFAGGATEVTVLAWGWRDPDPVSLEVVEMTRPRYTIIRRRR